MRKYSRYALTDHAYIRAKQRISEKLILNIKKINKFELEIFLNNIIRNTPSIDIEANNNIIDSFLFKIPGKQNLYIVTIKDVIITIKKTSIESLWNSL